MSDFKKEDLKTGMICKLRGQQEHMRVVFIEDSNGSAIVCVDESEQLNSYKDDLTTPEWGEDYDIMEVFDSNMVSLWRRESLIIEYTLQQIADRLGKDVKTIRIKD